MLKFTEFRQKLFFKFQFIASSPQFAIKLSDLQVLRRIHTENAFFRMHGWANSMLKCQVRIHAQCYMVQYVHTYVAKKVLI